MMRQTRQFNTNWDEVEWDVENPFARVAVFNVGSDRHGGQPTALLIDYKPGIEVPPHRHESDYFSTVVRGRLRIGKEWHEPGSIRFVKAGTGYGPLTVGPEGCRVVEFFGDVTGTFPRYFQLTEEQRRLAEEMEIQGKAKLAELQRGQDERSERHEFASPGWLDHLHKTIERLVREAGADVENINWSVCEVFTNAPEHLAQTTDRTIAWYCHIRGRDVDFGLGELKDADTVYKLVADYDSVLPLARVVHGDDPDTEAKIAKTLADAVAQGKMRVHGRHDSRPEALAKLHDEMVHVTL